MQKRDKILTIPNIITIARLVFLVPLVFITLESPFVGAILAAILGFTDFLDGWIARKFNQESALGRILDPISDRALMAICFVLFIYTESIPLFYVALIGLRELLIALGTIYVSIKSKVRLDVNRLGKISAFAAMAATPAWVLSSETNGFISTFWQIIALIGTVISVPTGYISIVQYFSAFKSLEKSG